MEAWPPYPSSLPMTQRKLPCSAGSSCTCWPEERLISHSVFCLSHTHRPLLGLMQQRGDYTANLQCAVGPVSSGPSFGILQVTEAQAASLT